MTLEIRVWEPKAAVDDSTLGTLPGNETLDGMLKEIENLNSKRLAYLYCRGRNPKVKYRTITCRRITTRKGPGPGVVRAQIVVKDVAGKSAASARSMGISSPTPSADALFLR